MSRRKKLFYTFAILLFGSFVLLIVISDPSESPGSNQQQPPPQPTKAIQSLPNQPSSRIETIIQRVADADVYVGDSQYRLGADAQPPLEVIVTVTGMDSCFAAKDALLNIMRSIYTDSIAGANVSFVQVNFTFPPYLQASLSAADGASVSREIWDSTGPTNLLSILQQVNSSQTWAKVLEGCR